MSYRETFEFFAIDRALAATEMRALRAISTRAAITPTRFYNVYDWGGLKADPRAMLRRYFDLFVYTCEGARWGMLRLPASRVDARQWRRYVSEQRGRGKPDACASFVTRNGWTILTLSSAERTEFAADDMLDDASWGVPLAVLRSELLSGDLRGLYLAWLCLVQAGERRAICSTRRTHWR